VLSSDGLPVDHSHDPLYLCPGVPWLADFLRQDLFRGSASSDGATPEPLPSVSKPVASTSRVVPTQHDLSEDFSMNVEDDTAVNRQHQEVRLLQKNQFPVTWANFIRTPDMAFLFSIFSFFFATLLLGI